MLELGTGEAEAHRAVGAEAARAGVDVLVTVGPRAAAMTERFGGEAHSVANAAEAASLARKLLRPGDLVLVKASRGIGLEAVADALRAEPAGSRSPRRSDGEPPPASPRRSDGDPAPASSRPSDGGPRG
jgi:UDP-N-acetylmuramoyl-tripeptide--D-alanyl-D-alanine ligase